MAKITTLTFGESKDVRYPRSVTSAIYDATTGERLDNTLENIKESIQTYSAGDGIDIDDTNKISIKDTRTFSYNLNRGVRMVAHRGYTDTVPENSLKSIGTAGEFGYWGCEIDIRETSDGHFVLMHDATIDRTTDWTGTLSTMTLAEVQKVTLTQSIYSDNSLANFTLGIPTLEEALRKMLQYNLHPVIEIKSLQGNDSIPRLLEEIEATLGTDCDFTIIDFDLTRCKLVRINNALCGIHYLSSSVLTNEVCDEIRALDMVASVSYSKLTGETDFEVYAKSIGLPIATWTVNDGTKVPHMKEWGIYSITTDYIIDYQCPKMMAMVTSVNRPTFKFKFIGHKTDSSSLQLFGDEDIRSANNNRAYETNLFKITGANKVFAPSSSTYNYGMTIFDCDGHRLKDLGWLSDTGNSLTTNVDGISSFPPYAVYGYLYARRIDGADMNTTTDYTALRNLELTLAHQFTWSPLFE